MKQLKFSLPNERGAVDMNNVIFHKLIDVTKEGITLESNVEKIYIDFNDCVKNYSLEKGKKCNCVADRDITTLSFTFYTNPKTNVIFQRTFLKKLGARKTAISEFLDMQKAIAEAGYTSYDLS